MLVKMNITWLCSFLCLVMIASEVKGDEFPILISLRLKVSEVHLGDKVALDELLPDSANKRPVSIDHFVLRIGRYDKKHGRLVNISVNEFLPTDPRFAFRDLPGNSTAPHGIKLVSDKSGMKRCTFEFTPRRIGIFLITTEWTQRDLKSISSNPVILIVNPPKDAGGKIEAEWLREWND